MRTCFFLFLIHQIQAQPYGFEKVYGILKEPFNLCNPTIIDIDGTITSNPGKLRSYYTSFQLCSLKVAMKNETFTEGEKQSPTLIMVPDDNTILEQALDYIDIHDLGVASKVMMTVESNHMALQLELIQQIRINQEVYVVDLETLTLFEVYRINDVAVMTQIGHYKSVTSLHEKLELKFDFKVGSAWLPSLGQRRNNLYGQHLIAMTEDKAPYIWFKKGYKTNAVFHESNETYDVTDHIYGYYHDIFLKMSEKLNFTFSVYNRKDGVITNQLALTEILRCLD